MYKIKVLAEVEQTMEVANQITPNEEQIKGLLAPGHDGSIYMLNLLKFKDDAEYEDGRDTDLTGQEAYGIYGLEVARLLAIVGGALMFNARVERLMLGEVEELWDSAAIASQGLLGEWYRASFGLGWGPGVGGRRPLVCRRWWAASASTMACATSSASSPRACGSA